MTDEMAEQLHNREAEESLVGAVMVDPSQIKEPTIAGLDPAVFHIRRLAQIWVAARERNSNGESVDTVTIGEALRRGSQLNDVGGQAFLTQLATNTEGTTAAYSRAKVIQLRRR